MFMVGMRLKNKALRASDFARCGDAKKRVARVAIGAVARGRLRAWPRLGVCVALLTAMPSAFHATRADEFSTVPAGDPLYRQMAVVARAAWTGVPASQGSNATLTRYEMALETAKAVIAATARDQSGGNWSAPPAKAALRALRELCVSLRPELKTLGVDVPATLRLLDGLLKAPAQRRAALPNSNAPSADETQAVNAVPDASAVGVSAVDSRGDAMRGGVWRGVPLSLSQRLHLTAALSDLKRDALDPFGNSAVGRFRFARNPLGPVLSRSSARASDATDVVADASGLDASGLDTRMGFDVSRRLRLRAAMNRHVLEPQGGLQNIWTPGARTASTLGGGLDIGLGSLKLAGDVESLSTDAPDSPSWTRLSGGLGFNAWQNRVSLKVNLSRLVPDDVQLLPSTVAGLNVDLNMTERLSLTMLYQQMFGSPAPDHADHMVGGGISIKF